MPSSFLTDYSVPPLASYSDVTPAFFHEKILPKAQPCILRGVANNWPSVAAATQSHKAIADYFLSLDQGGTAQAFVAPTSIDGRYFYRDDMSGFNFDRRIVPIAEIIRKLLGTISESGAQTIYAGATKSDELFPGFGEENSMPLVEDNIRPLVWIGNRSRVAPHFDASDNIACAVAGTRRFLLFPPEQLKNLYVGPIDNTMAGQPASLVDPRAIDETRYPNFITALKNAQLATLNPGDGIFIPSMWWHYVEADGPFNVLVNYWWDNSGLAARSMDCLALALLVMRDLPDAQRTAWRSHFDHYIFSETAQNAVNHIPPHARGPLGQKSPQRDQAIKSFLRASLPSLLK